MKRLVASGVASGLLLFVNLTEFVDEGERIALKTAAGKFCMLLRSLRFLELVAVIVYVGWNRNCEMIYHPTNPISMATTTPVPERFRDLLLIHHLPLFVIFIFTNICYYGLIVCGFHRSASQASAENVPHEHRSFVCLQAPRDSAFAFWAGN